MPTWLIIVLILLFVVMPALLLWFMYTSKVRTFHGADGSPYLTRWTLFDMGPLGRIVLHQFYRPDADEEMHDHPWPFLSLVIKGWYVEELGGCAENVHRRRFSLAYRQAAIPHRVSAMSEGGCWTILWTGRDTGREWGFYTKRGWVPWREFLNLSVPDPAP